MSALGNLIWFIFGGEIFAALWLLLAGFFYITIIGAPLGRACLEFAQLSAFPFGKEIVREKELNNIEDYPTWKKVINAVLNVLWFGIGFVLTIAYVIAGIISFITIVGIPVGIVYIRMGKFLLLPIGARVLSKKKAFAAAAVNEIERRQIIKA